MAVRSGQDQDRCCNHCRLGNPSAPRRTRLRIEDVPFGREKGSGRHFFNNFKCVVRSQARQSNKFRSRKVGREIFRG